MNKIMNKIMRVIITMKVKDNQEHREINLHIFCTLPALKAKIDNT